MSLLPRREDMFWADATAPDGFMLDGMRFDGQAVANGAKVAEGDKVLVARTTHGLTPGRRRGMVILQSSHGATRRGRSRPFFQTGIGIGAWDQQWGNPYTNGASVTSAVNPDAPDDAHRCFEWSANPDDVDDPLYLTPLGLVAHKAGKIWFVHDIYDPEAEDNSTFFVGFRVVLLTPNESFWSTACETTVTFDKPYDRQFDRFAPSCNVFYDAGADILTVIPNQNSAKQGEFDDTNNKKCSVWTIAPNGGLTALTATFSEVDLDQNQQLLTNVNCVGAYLVTGALRPTGKLLAYARQLDGTFVDLWNRDWADWSDDGAKVVLQRGALASTTPNYGLAWNRAAFSQLVARYTTGGGLLGADGAELLLVSFAQADGASTDLTLDTTSAFARADADDLLKLESVIGPLAAAAKDSYFPNDGNSSFTHHTLTLDDSSTIEWDYTIDYEWLGVLYQQQSWSYIRLSPVYGENETATARIPSTDLADFGSGILIPLPSAFPNTASTLERAWWSGAAAVSRDWDTATGYRFRAALKGTPVIVPASTTNGTEVAQVDTDPNSYIDSYTCGTPGTTQADSCPPDAVGGVAWYVDKEHRQYKAGYLPDLKVNYETWFYVVAPDNSIRSIKLSARWTGLDWQTGDTLLTITESLGVPENIWAVVPVESLNLVLVMGDKRSAGSADPMPHIWAINYAGTGALSIAYEIPASHFMPGDDEIEDIWETDQTYMDGDDEIVWAKAGTLKRGVHGVNDAAPPEMKLCNSSAEGGPRLIIGAESVARVEPTTGTAGDTADRLTVLRIRSDGYDDEGTIETGSSWTWPSVNALSRKTSGPDVVRGMCITDQLLVWPTQGTAFDDDQRMILRTIQS